MPQTHTIELNTRQRDLVRWALLLRGKFLTAVALRKQRRGDEDAAAAAEHELGWILSTLDVMQAAKQVRALRTFRVRLETEAAEKASTAVWTHTPAL